MPFAFTPADGLKNVASFPTTPANEAAARTQIQTPLDQLKDYINSVEYLADTGAANAYAVTFPSSIAPTVYAAGMRVTFKAANANTGASTLNVNGLGVKTICKSVGVGLNVGDILAGQIVIVEYGGTNFQLLSANSAVQVTATRDISLTGVQAISLPFTAKKIEIRAFISGGLAWTTGVWTQDGNQYAMSYNPTAGVSPSAAAAYIRPTVSDYVLGTVQNVSNTGFEINWAKTGSPTGTATLYIAASN